MLTESLFIDNKNFTDARLLREIRNISTAGICHAGVSTIGTKTKYS